MKTMLDINTLPEIERKFYLENSWCDRCQEADLGIENSELYLEAGRKYIGGNCKICGEVCKSEIIEKQGNS